MVRDFNDNFKEFLNSLMGDNLDALRSDNDSFMELEDYEMACYDAAKVILDAMPPEKKATLEAFLEASVKVHGQRAEFLYQQGLKDAVRFLEFFEVF